MAFVSIGGNNITGSTPGEVSSKYDDWINSLETKPDICGIGKFHIAMMPIWELIADPVIAGNLEAEFDRQTLTSEMMLEGFKPSYITDIVVYSGGTWEVAKSQVPAGYILVRLNPGVEDAGLLDTNAGAGVPYIIIAYKLGADKSQAVVDVNAIEGTNTPAGHERIAHNLNPKGRAIYIVYRRANDSDTVYLREIRGVYSSNYSLPAGWSWTTNRLDLSKGAGGKDIFLVLRKD